MAIVITDECINCGACEPECPNNAIYEGGAMWNMAEGTSITDMFTRKDGTEIGAYDEQESIDEDLYFIVPDKCTECQGFHDDPQCASVCPVDCCPTDENYPETEEELLAKQQLLHDE